MDFRIPFSLVLTLATVALALVPAVTIWVVFMDLMTASVDLLKATTEDSTESMAEAIQELLILRAIDAFDARLTEADREMAALLATVKASGLQRYDLRPSHFDIPTNILAPFWKLRPGFATMRGHPYFTNLAITGSVVRDPSDTYATHLFWVTWAVFYRNRRQGDLNLTLFGSTLVMDPAERWSTLDSYEVDQETGERVRQRGHSVLPSTSFTVEISPGGWDTVPVFNSYVEQAELSTGQWVPAQNNTLLQVRISINTATVSHELWEELSEAPDDRLVLFFREPHGYMIASSHGQYWRKNVANSVNVSPADAGSDASHFQFWNCTRSTDALIQEACQQLFAAYQSWPAIPALRQNTVLGGQRYWLATGFSSGGLRATALMLKRRATVMGDIDAANARVDQHVADRKGVTFVILGVVSAIAVTAPLAVGFWLAAWLYKLAGKMDGIARLQFATGAAEGTVFRELHRFQASFTQMERGLQAFGKFVPQAVVKVLIAGQMKVNDEMHPKTLTIMFADIEGFSAICERETPATLVTVCTEYFEAMCGDIVQRNGTLDKFIGDCIMAMWNAPEPLPGHERDAVAAALAMQNSVMGLHHSWQQRGLPRLKFRLGLHTGVCLVGNFGCTHRVSYTCLGDGVNLAARLEALNKKFGTYLCVSHATYEGCRDYFHFRRLAKVTVPGKTEVLPVYEVLCPADPSPLPSPKLLHSPFPCAAPPAPDPAQASCPYSPSLVQVAAPPADHQRQHKPPPVQVAHHWAYVDLPALLQFTRLYEQTYEALVGCSPAEAKQLLATKTLLDVPDPAWAALGRQLEGVAAGEPWDGVFHFTEK